MRHLANSSRSRVARSEVAVLGGDEVLEQISHGASDSFLPQGTRHNCIFRRPRVPLLYEQRSPAAAQCFKRRWPARLEQSVLL